MHALTTHPRIPSPAAMLVALAGAVAATTVIVIWGAPAAPVVMLAPAAASAVSDARESRLPDRFALLAALPLVPAVLVQATAGRLMAAAGAVVAGTALFAMPLLVVHLVVPDAMGFGDVKLAAALGAGLGLLDPRASLVALCIATFATAAVGLAWWRASIPFGPGIVGATSTCVVLTAVLDERWWPWR